jgi:nicotinamidase-related amidase
VSRHSIYLLLDMENDLIHKDGPNGKNAYAGQVSGRRIIENSQAALKQARDAGVLVGYVRVGFSPDYSECPATSPIFDGARKAGIFKLGSWGTEIHPDIAPRSGDFDIVKHRVSPFYSTHLEVILRARQISRIYCSGISTNAVVQATVREGHDRDFDMIVLEDCCCASSEQEHENAIGGLARFCRITNSRDVVFE